MQLEKAMSKSRLLNNVLIAKPCDIEWNRLPGNGAVRNCTHCERSVYNLSAMTKSEAEAFITEFGTSQCVSFYRKSDGTILTDDCPAGLRQIRNTARSSLHSLFRIIMSVIAFFCAGVSAANADDCENSGMFFLRTQGSRTHEKYRLPKLELGPYLLDGPLFSGYFAVNVVPMLQKTEHELFSPSGFSEVLTPGSETVIRSAPDQKYPSLAIHAPFQDNVTFLLFNKGLEAEQKDNFAVARFYYETAIEACETSTINHDPMLRKVICQRLEAVSMVNHYFAVSEPGR